jgi:hypothetical protein
MRKMAAETDSRMERGTNIRSGLRALWRRCHTDPVLFMRELLELEPHPGQARWLANANRPENLLHTGNRWGKSLIQAVRLLHRALFQYRPLRYDGAPYRVCNVSITQDQANIVLSHLLRLVRGRSTVELFVSDVVFTPFPCVTLGNDSQIRFRSTQRRGEYLLGHDYDIISFDEAAFEPEPDYVVDQVIRMRLADRGGTLDLISTPKGKNWLARRAGFLEAHPDLGYVQGGHTEENATLPRAFLEQQKQWLSARVVAQNLAGEFVESGDELIAEQYIQKALQLGSGLKSPEPHRWYVHGWDLGRKQSYTVGITLDATTIPIRLVAFDRFRDRNWPDVVATIRDRFAAYGGQITIDATGLGDVVLAELSDLPCEGFVFSAGGGRAKTELLANILRLHERGEIAYPECARWDSDGSYWSLPNELRQATWTENDFADALMALALAAWPLRPASPVAALPPPRVARGGM